MADTTLQTTAAAAVSTPGGAPAGAGPTASSSNHQPDAELSLAEALALDLAEPDDKKGKEGADSQSDKDDSDDDSDDHGDDDDSNKDDDQDDDDDSDKDDDDSDDDDGKDDDADDDKSDDKSDKDDDAPKGLEDLPKWAQKRIQKQSESLRTLKAQIAQGGITLTPTATMPLAHVRTQEELDKEIQAAETVRQRLGKIKEEDYQDGPDGPQVEVQVGKQKFVLSKAEVDENLAQANAVLDVKAITSRKDYLNHREQHKPWEVAEQIVPGILEKDTPANKAYMHLMQLVPEMAARVPDYEFIMACAVLGLSQYKDQASGKAKWQRFELDAKGNIIPPKRKAEEKDKQQKKDKPAPAVPSNQRPAMRPAGAKATAADLDELQKRAEAGDTDAQRELMKAEMSS